MNKTTYYSPDHYEAIRTSNFNHTLLELFRAVIPDDSNNCNITFGCRSIHNGLLLLRFGSRLNIDGLLRIPYIKKNQQSRHFGLTSLLFHKSSSNIGTFNENFLSYIRERVPVLFNHISHDGVRVTQDQFNVAKDHIEEETIDHFKEISITPWFDYKGDAQLRTVSRFKGSWSYFQSKNTVMRKFWFGTGERDFVKIPMMISKIKRRDIDRKIRRMIWSDKIVYRIQYNSGASLVIITNYSPPSYKELYKTIKWFTERKIRFKMMYDKLQNDENIIETTGLMFPVFHHETSIDLSERLCHHDYINMEGMFIHEKMALDRIQYKEKLTTSINFNENGTSAHSIFDSIANPPDVEDDDNVAAKPRLIPIETAKDDDSGKAYTNHTKINKSFAYIIVLNSGVIAHMGIFNGHDKEMKQDHHQEEEEEEEEEEKDEEEEEEEEEVDGAIGFENY